MSDVDDPVRWSTDAGAPPAMRALLRAVADDGPSGNELASLKARVQPLLSSPATPSAMRWLTSARAIGIGVAVIGAGLAGYLALRTDRATAPIAQPAPAVEPTPAPPPLVEAPPAAPPAPSPAPSPAPVEAPASAPKPEPKRAAAHGKPTAKPAAIAPAPPPAVSEVELLEQARTAMRSGDAGRALELIGEHERLYADGALVEEREALVIEALAKLGRRDEARARWMKFATSYPRSNYRGRLQRVMGVQDPP
jgi:outer membrane biosynthesis protein TonB